MAKIPCVITIEEISRRRVIIMVDDNDKEPHAYAEEIAANLCNTDKIQLDFEDIMSRTCTFHHEATENELHLLTVFDPDDIPDESV